ncbi:MAG: 2-oxoglutarate synthase subunit KorA [Methanoregula sp. PtaU1.Bin051]|nr:MAG: 2-oxoglutarate synthase subunit KorA [Methanoregula sp. PtaU1.Bin051]
MVHETSVLVGGKAGEGINSAGMVVAQLLNRLGYYTFMYYDYPSLIRGGHNFAIIRASDRQIGIHRDAVDYVLALNQETLERHEDRFDERTVRIFNSDVVRDEGQGVSVSESLKAENAPAIMGNSTVIGAFAKAAGIPWDTVVNVFTRHLPKGTQQNLAVAKRGYDQVAAVNPITPVGDRCCSLVSGNEAAGLGLVAGGITAYVAYPMTPSSGLLHFLAENAWNFGVSVVHPENEIAVILMALGYSYAGRRAAVGTSGGGFCLMTEGLSLAGMAEIPIVIFVSQRTGPSTGLPTYTAQSDLRFILNAGQGEFPRFVAAPGDAGQAYYWSAVAADMAWRYQVPAFILADKTLSEGMYSIDLEKLPMFKTGAYHAWDGMEQYRRYAYTDSGISPLAFPGAAGAIVKVNGYAHDASGITTEDGGIVSQMTKKRLLKGENLAAGLKDYDTVDLAGVPSAETAVICWGSVRGACLEACEALGIRMVQPVVLSPFPDQKLRESLKGARRVIVVEENATGQLAALLRLGGFQVDATILHYDGRPLTPDLLKAHLKEVLQ